MSRCFSFQEHCLVPNPETTAEPFGSFEGEDVKYFFVYVRKWVAPSSRCESLELDGAGRAHESGDQASELEYSATSDLLIEAKHWRLWACPCYFPRAFGDIPYGYSQAFQRQRLCSRVVTGTYLPLHAGFKIAFPGLTCVSGRSLHRTVLPESTLEIAWTYPAGRI